MLQRLHRPDADGFCCLECDLIPKVRDVKQLEREKRWDEEVAEPEADIVPDWVLSDR